MLGTSSDQIRYLVRRTTNVINNGGVANMSTTENKESILCPSFQCEEGAILLDIVKKDGHISFASEKIVVDKEFVQIAHLGRSPEKRFRFSGKCMNEKCKQWTGKSCGIIERIIETFGPTNTSIELPKCSIRAQCRWYKQCGSKACAICPEVITDLL
jgi:hypothetical protein